MTARVNPDGTFEFSGVVPNEYDMNVMDGAVRFKLAIPTPQGCETMDSVVGPGREFFLRWCRRCYGP